MQLIIKFLLGYSMKIVIGGWGGGGGRSLLKENFFLVGGGRANFQLVGISPCPQQRKPCMCAKRRQPNRF